MTLSWLRYIPAILLLACLWVSPALPLETQNANLLLLRAAQVGESSLLTSLLEQNEAEVEARSADGLTPLLLAAFGGHSSAARTLLLHGADAGAVGIQEAGGAATSALHLAAWRGHADVVELLLELGRVGVESGRPRRRRGERERAHHHGIDGKDGGDDATPLMLASARCNLDALDVLLAAGADVFARNTFGETALMLAAFRGCAEACAELLAWGATVVEVNHAGDSALAFAARNGHVEVVLLLLRNGAPAQGRNTAGQSASHFAAWHGHAKVLQRLLGTTRSGENHWGLVDAPDEDGETALMMAAFRGKTSAAALLIERGARVDAAQKAGYTPLMLAARGGHTRMATILSAAGADLDRRNHRGDTALATAAWSGHAGLVAALVSSGADPNATNNAGVSALEQASARGHAEICDMLVRVTFPYIEPLLWAARRYVSSSMPYGSLSVRECLGPSMWV